MILNIFDVPPSLNQWSRMHWSKAAKIKKQWENDIFYSTRVVKQVDEKVCKKMPYKQAKIKITYYFKTKHRHDKDNYTPKFILDGLVKAGIILDDSDKIIGQTEIIFDYDKDNPRTKVMIEEVI